MEKHSLDMDSIDVKFIQYNAKLARIKAKLLKSRL